MWALYPSIGGASENYSTSCTHQKDQFGIGPSAKCRLKSMSCIFEAFVRDFKTRLVGEDLGPGKM